MPTHLLHGLWLPESGFNLWVEQTSGHRIVTMERVPEGTFPPIVHSLIGSVEFRHRAKIRLQTPRGKAVNLVAPTAALAPAQAVSFLASVEHLGFPTPAASEDQRAAIAPDMYWLIRMYSGLMQFVRAGRGSIHVEHSCTLLPQRGCRRAGLMGAMKPPARTPPTISFIHWSPVRHCGAEEQHSPAG